MSSDPSNPFQTPEAIETGSEIAEPISRKVGWFGVVLVGLSIIIAVVGIVTAAMLIPQAMERSKAARQQENIAIKADDEKIARSSLVLGMTSVVCSILALISIVFPFQGRHDISAVLLCSCAASIVIVAIIFKPF